MSSVTITDNTVEVANRILLNSSIFLRMAAEETVRISTPNTPKKTGRLRMDVVKQVLGLSGKIIWGKNYAIYQESKLFRNYTTAGTGPNFAKNGILAMIKLTSKIAKAANLTT